MLTSLLDKPQIGPVILDTILYDVFRALYLTCLNQANILNSVNGRCVSFTGDIMSLKYGSSICGKTSLNKEFLSKSCSELTKNANLFFSTLEAYYVWNYLGKIYENAITNNPKEVAYKAYHVNDIGCGKPNILELCTLTDFLLDIIPIETYIDNTSEILPNLFISIVTLMKENIKTLNKQQITQSLELCTKILNKIQPAVVKNIAKFVEPTSKEEQNEMQKSQINVLSESLPDNSLTVSAISELENNNNVVTTDVSNPEDVKFGTTLEKSKSDSKINENSLGSDLNNLNRERSNSNQMVKNKKNSPRIDKKSKNKKSKSSSKLYDLKKEDQASTSSTELLNQEKTEVPFKEDAVLPTVQIHVRTENKHIIKCLKSYKSFYVTFMLSKILPDVNIHTSFEKLQFSTDNRTKDLEDLLQRCINEDKKFCLKIENLSCSQSDINSSTEKLVFQHSEYNSAMRLASNILLEFNTFPEVLEEHTDECDLPFWLKVLIICACSTQKQHPEIQMIAMSTLLEMLSLAKTQNFNREQSDNNTEIVVMGILDGFYVNYIENYTHIIEVRNIKNIKNYYTAFTLN